MSYRRQFRVLSILCAACGSGLLGSAARAVDFTWTDANNDGNWFDNQNWQSPSGPGIPATLDTAHFVDSTAIAATGGGMTIVPYFINLESFTQGVDTVSFDNTINDSGVNGFFTYNISNGTLLLNTIVNNALAPGQLNGQDVFSTANEINANVQAANSDINVVAAGPQLVISGQITANNLFVSGGGGLELVDTNNINTLQIQGAGTTVAVFGAGSLGAANVITTSGGTIAVVGSAPYGFNVTEQYNNTLMLDDQSTVHVIASQNNAGSPATDSINFSEIDLGPGTTNPDGSTSTSVTLITEDTTALSTDTLHLVRGINNLTLNDNGGVNPGQFTIGALIENQDFSFNPPASQLNFNGKGIYTITTEFQSSNLFNYSVTIGNGTMVHTTGAFPFSFHGATLTVNSGGTYLADQTPFYPGLPTHVMTYGAIGGDLSQAIFSGPGQNVTLDPDAILFGITSNAPQRGVDVSSPIYLAGIISSNQVVDCSAPDSIYHGIAFGAYYTPPALPFSGSVTEASPGPGIEVYNNTVFQDIDGATFNTTNTTTGVTFSGPGETRLRSATLGTASVYTAVGDPAGSSGNYIFTIYGASTLSAGRTLNVSNGVFFSDDNNSVDPAAVVNIGDGGAFQPGDFNDINSPTTGTYNFAAGSAIYIDNASDRLDAGAIFHFAANSSVVFGPDLFSVVDTGSPTWLPPQADIVLEGQLVDASNIVLGDSRRLTTSTFNSVANVNSPAVTAAAGASKVIFSAADGTSLGINAQISLPGVDLQVGDAAVSNGFTFFNNRAAFAQDGNVNLYETFDQNSQPQTDTVRDLTLNAGGLNVSAPLSARNVTDNSAFNALEFFNGLTLGGSITANAGTIVLDNFFGGPIAYSTGSAIIINGGTVQYGQYSTPILPAGGITITVGPSGELDNFTQPPIDGGFDPFSDDKGNRITILNNGQYVTAFGSLNGPANITGTGSIVMDSGTIITDYIRQSSVEIGTNATLKLNAVRQASVIGSLLIDDTTSDQFDVNSDALILPYTITSPASTIAGFLAIGYNGGAWNGNGIASSAAANDSSHLTALGYGEAADLGITSVDGTPVTGNAVIVRYTYYGDSSLDGKVDLGNDFNLFLQGFLTGGATWELGDYNYDGKVDLADFALFIQGYKSQGGSLGALDDFIADSGELTSSQKHALLSVVPEPSSAALLAIGCALLARRRSHKM